MQIPTNPKAKKPILDGRIITLHKHMIKIAEFGQDHFEELEQRLMTICCSLGITEPPDREQMKEMVEFLMKQYADFGLEEIAYAFELYCADNLPECKELEHYNKFLQRFVGKILNAYRKLRSGRLKIEDKRLELIKELELEKQKEKKILSESERLESWKLSHDTFVSYLHRNNQLPLTWMYPHVYNWLKHEGKVAMDDTARQGLKLRAITQLKSEDMQESISRRKQRTEDKATAGQLLETWNDDVTVTARMKKLYMLDWATEYLKKKNKIKK